MTRQPGTDLGHGVRVVPGEGEDLVVLSEHFDLGWRSRDGARPGSAVVWRGSGFEVVSVEPWRHGCRWRLEPWGGHDVMRVTLPLDPASVAAAAEQASRDRTADRLQPVLTLLMPVLGFAVRRWQTRWRDEWRFPAAGATVVSALIEVMVGAMSAVELMVSMGAGASVFPWLPRPVVVVGPFFLVEGLVRLALVVADSEPVGSALGLAVAAFEPRRPPPRSSPEVPEIAVCDPEAERIQVVSPIQRRDLERPGVLPYRGDGYRLSATERLGSGWVYSFVRTELDDHAPRLRLLPPRSKAKAPPPASPGLVRTVLLTVVTTLAPARFQHRWADEIGMNPMWLTVIGGSAELAGGLINIRSVPAADPMSLLLNLFFIAEGALRLVTVLTQRRVLGSMIGWLLTPLLEWALPESAPSEGG